MLVRGWRVDGTFEQLDAALRERPWSRPGRNPLPSAGVSPTPGPPRIPPELAVNREDTTPTRRFEAGSGTCWWTPRVSYSGQSSGAPRSWTGTGPRRYCGRRTRRLPAPNIHGSAPATEEMMGQGLGGEEARLERGARVAPTQTRRGKLAYGMGRAMVARGRGGRLGEAVATEGVRSAAALVGSGTHFCVDLS